MSATAKKLSHRDGELPEAPLATLLRGSLLFQGASDEAVAYIASCLEAKAYRRGEPVVLQNESGDHVYFVKSGSVEIVRFDHELRQQQRLATLQSGANFSELSVLTGSRKSASAYALEDCELLRMDGVAFLAVLQRYPQIARRLATQLSQLYHELLTQRLYIPAFKPEQFRPSPALLRMLPQEQWKRHEVLPLSLEGAVLKVALADPYQRGFLSHMEKSFPKIITEVTRASAEEILEFQSFDAKKITAPALEAVEVPVAKDKAERALQLLKKNVHFSFLPEELLKQLVPHLKMETLEAGKSVFRAQDGSEKLYLIEYGRLRLQKHLPGSSARIEVASLGAGDSLGEVSLLAGVHHSLTAVTLTPTNLFSLPKKIFERLLESPDFLISLAKRVAQHLQHMRYGGALATSAGPSSKEVIAAIQVLPRDIIERHKVLPLKATDAELTLGVVNPDDSSLYPAISRYVLSHRVQFQIISEGELKRWLDAYDAEATKRPSEAAANIGSELEAGNVVALVDKLVLEGFRRRASDIHIEPTANHVTVRYRTDGVLHEFGEKISPALGKELVNRLKIVSDLDITQRHLPQDGQMRLKLNAKEVLARVSLLPTKHGEKAVLRLIRTQSSVIPLDMIAPDRYVISVLRAICGLSQGLFLVTGPTGSGKSTTLYSMLSALNRVDVNIVTLEDPVEMDLSGISQVQINEKTGLTFAKALRSVLRQDPDVIMVGEIRDAESARICFEAGITGHLVLSTLHTTSSLDVLPRLKELDVAPSVISAGLSGALAQRLVRAVCPKCVTTRAPTRDEIELIKTHLQIDHFSGPVHEGKGCAHCGGTGYYGRIPVIEVWKSSPEIAELTLSGAPTLMYLNALKRTGFVTMFEFGLRMALHGLTTISEVDRCVPR